MRPLERRFHDDAKFHELVSVLADSVQSRRIKLEDVQDAVTLLKHARGLFSRAVWTPPPRF